MIDARNIKLASLLIFVILLIGCKEASNMHFSELEEYRAEMRIENNELIIKLENPPGFMVSDIEKTLIEENIYLVANRISSGGGIREYKINLSWHTLPADIKEHIYWVNPDASATKLHPEYLK